jgi:hypothetical protein
MKAKKHAKPESVITSWTNPPTWRWEICPRCKQIRQTGKEWKRACIADKRATRYMGL